MEMEKAVNINSQIEKKGWRKKERKKPFEEKERTPAQCSLTHLLRLAGNCRRHLGSVQQVCRPPRQENHFGLTIVAFVVRVHLLVGNIPNHHHDLGRLADQHLQLGVIRLEKLEERPDSDMLEGWVVAFEESLEVAMDAPSRLPPIFDEHGVIANFSFRQAND